MQMRTPTELIAHIQRSLRISTEFGLIFTSCPGRASTVAVDVEDSDSPDLAQSTFPGTSFTRLLTGKRGMLDPSPALQLPLTTSVSHRTKQCHYYEPRPFPNPNDRTRVDLLANLRKMTTIIYGAIIPGGRSNDISMTF
ncbi:hypothetical protein WA026_007940 [Henosepilachna vigintioctopunctata]|uniref:Uncharacterized protein n=1 Tax=Henosepilachna vigintioctopunctata TaxID=420089 RepID=A0AAW1TT92_9CUCU